jgi:proline racemase
MLGLDASFSVVDSHTAGHPTRVVLSGIPPLPGDSVRARRDNFRQHHDDLRPLLLHEPRGHAAMVALVPVPSAVADYGCFFISSYVYLDMCGHGTIGYARTLAATGALTRETAPERFTLETPAGIVDVGLVWADDGALAGVRLRNVPSYVAAEDVAVTLDGVGEVRADLAYGGMWYLLVDAGPLGLALDGEHVTPALSLGSRLKAAFNEVLHARGLIDPADKASVLFYSDAQGEPAAARHLLVLEANKFDRSPCGTGTAARTAQLVHRGRLPVGGRYRAENLLGVAFEATVVAEMEATGRPAVIVEIAGNAHITAFSTIVRERGDPLPTGFLCR